MRESIIYQEILQEGRQEGQQEEAIALILRLLSHRFGPPDETTQARLSSLPISALEDLGEALLEFSNPADLQAWLATYHP